MSANKIFMLAFDRYLTLHFPNTITLEFLVALCMLYLVSFDWWLVNKRLLFSLYELLWFKYLKQWFLSCNRHNYLIRTDTCDTLYNWTYQYSTKTYFPISFEIFAIILLNMLVLSVHCKQLEVHHALLFIKWIGQIPTWFMIMNNRMQRIKSVSFH